MVLWSVLTYHPSVLPWDTINSVEWTPLMGYPVARFSS